MAQGLADSSNWDTVGTDTGLRLNANCEDWPVPADSKLEPTSTASTGGWSTSSTSRMTWPSRC